MLRMIYRCENLFLFAEILHWVIEFGPLPALCTEADFVIYGTKRFPSHLIGMLNSLWRRAGLGNEPTVQALYNQYELDDNIVIMTSRPARNTQCDFTRNHPFALFRDSSFAEYLIDHGTHDVFASSNFPVFSGGFYCARQISGSHFQEAYGRRQWF